MSQTQTHQQTPPWAALPGEDWWQYLQRVRAILQTANARFERGEDIAALIDQVRGESDRVDGTYWELEWQKHHGGSNGCSSTVTA